MTVKTLNLLFVLFAGVLLATACSGTELTSDEPPLFDEEANAPIEQIDTGSGGVASGPIDGLLTVQPSFGFGAYAVDAATGQAVAIPGVAAVESVDRNRDVIVSGDAAFALGSKVREGQSFAADISVVKFDYVTGQVRQLAALGFDNETDDSQERITHRLHAVAGNSVVVSAGNFVADDTTYTVYDATTGQETGSFGEPRYEWQTDSGSCSGGISDLVGLSDGRLAGVALDSPAIVDLGSGEIELMIGCDEDEPELADHVTVADLNDYAVFAEGAAFDDDGAARLLDVDLSPDHGFIEGGGDLWWISVDSRSVDDARAIVGGVVQFDLETEAVEAVHPLGVHLGAYIDCAPDGDTCELQNIAQAEMRYIDERLVIVDVNENGSVLTLDPATSAIAATELELRGVDYTDATLLSGDRTSVWIQVRRMTVTSDDENGRSAVGDSYLERIDAQTGKVTISLAGEDLFG